MNEQAALGRELSAHTNAISCPVTGMTRLPVVIVWTVQVLCNTFNPLKLWSLRRARSWSC